MLNSLEMLNGLSEELAGLGYVAMVQEQSERLPVPQLFCHLAERTVQTDESAEAGDEPEIEAILAQVYFSSDLAEKAFSLKVDEAEQRLAVNVMLPSVELAGDPRDLALFAHFLNESATVGGYHFSDQDSTLYYRVVLPATLVSADLLEGIFDNILEAINLHLPMLEALAAGAISYEQAVKTVLTAVSAQILEAKGGVQ